MNENIQVNASEHPVAPEATKDETKKEFVQTAHEVGPEVLAQEASDRPPAQA